MVTKIKKNILSRDANFQLWSHDVFFCKVFHPFSFLDIFFVHFSKPKKTFPLKNRQKQIPLSSKLLYIFILFKFKIVIYIYSL
jgi:hypothetical protein